MPRGKLEPPNLDDRTWQELVDQAKALIPKYAPEWTDHSPSDPGIALIELFAWLVEGMTYRLNRVPDRTYIEFLNLLGVTRDPAKPATTVLAFTIAPGATPVLVDAGLQVGTPQTEADAAVVFETEESVLLLPANLQAALWRASGTTAKVENVTDRLTAKPLVGMAVPAPRDQVSQLVFGFDAAIDREFSLHISIPDSSLRMAQLGPGESIALEWTYSKSAPNSSAVWSDRILDVRDGTTALSRSGRVHFPRLADWTAQEANNLPGFNGSPPPVANQKWFWLRLAIKYSTPTIGKEVKIELSHVLFNSAIASSVLTTREPEELGKSNGQPFQRFELRRRPLYKQPGTREPYEHLKLETVEADSAGGERVVPWRAVDDFPQGPERVFRLNPVTGVVEFGNFAPNTPLTGAETSPGFGLIPPDGSVIRVREYRAVASGAKGNLPPDSVTVMRQPLAGVQRVTNPGTARGGADEEDLEQTKRRAPEMLRIRNRAVTAEDFEYLAYEASTAVKTARCLPPLIVAGVPSNAGRLDRSLGHVNVLIVPDAPPEDPRPRPTAELIDEVRIYLDDRRVITTSLTVTGPRYLEIKITGEIQVFPSPKNDQSFRDRLRLQLQEAVRRYLHPLHGGRARTGWRIGESLFLAGVFEVMQPLLAGVGFVSQLTAAGVAIDYERAGNLPTLANTVGVQLGDFELVCGSPSHDLSVRTVT